MKIISYTIAAILFFIVVGCMPLKQSEIISKSSDISGGYHSGYLLVYVDQSSWHEKFEINQVKTLVEGPGNKKYQTFIKPHDFDLRENKSNPRQRVYILNKDGKIVSSWKDGVYTLFLVLENQNDRITKELQIGVGTFIYSPVFHGAPN